MRTTRRTFVFRFGSPDDFAGFFRTNYGPVHKAFQALDEPGWRRLHDDLTALASARLLATGIDNPALAPLLDGHHRKGARS